MNWKVLKSKEDYKKASLRLMEIFHATSNTLEGDELELLLVLVKDYDEKHYHLPSIDPLEAIKIQNARNGN